MGVSGFIEKFFFISLGLVFILVVFLVYHFKNRITVAEKKNESMYGLLTAVVKEIKVLRGMFGLGSKEKEPPILADEPINIELKSKTPPEVDVNVSSEPIKNTFNSFVQSEQKEVITFEISASEDGKVVVSDMEDSELSDTESETDSEESETESNTEEAFLCLDESNHDLGKIVEEEGGEDEKAEDEYGEDNKEEDNGEDVKDEAVVVTLQDFETILDDIPATEQNLVEVLDMNASQEAVEEKQEERVEEDTATYRTKLSADQLKKMNINQLKSIASQLGITEDVSKMKKPELISLIQQK